MKHLTLPLVALAAAAMATSCSSDEPLANAADDGMTTFAISVPQEVASRVFGDGLTANSLKWAAYDITDGSNVYVADQDSIWNSTAVANPVQTTKTGDLTWQVKTKLVKGHNYKVVFAAKAGDADFFDFNVEGKDVHVYYDKITADNDNADAFYADYTTGNVSAAINRTITLYRPFAQINFGTDDLNAASVQAMLAQKGVTNANVETQLTVTPTDPNGLLNGFNVVDNTIKSYQGQGVTVAYPAGKLPLTETFPVAGYDYLSMNYLLVGPTANSNNNATGVTAQDNPSTLVDLTLSFSNLPSVTPIKVSGAPVKSNFRTNIYGSLFTSPATFNVVIDPIFEQPDNNIVITDFMIHNAQDYHNFLIDPNMTEAALAEDVTLPAFENVSSEKHLHLNGHTLTTQANGQIAKNGSLYLDNGIFEIKNDNGNQVGLWLNGNNASIHLDNVVMNVDNSLVAAIVPARPKKNNPKSGMSVNLSNSTITGGALTIMTQASSVQSDGYQSPVAINIDNCTLDALETPVLQLTNGEVNIKNSTLNGTNQGILCRNGFGVIDGCTINLTVETQPNNVKYYTYVPTSNPGDGNLNWSSGSDATFGGIVIGNRQWSGDNYYNFNKTFTADNTKVNVLGAYAANIASVYLVSEFESNVVLNTNCLTDLTSGKGIYWLVCCPGQPNFGNVTINGTTYTDYGNF